MSGINHIAVWVAGIAQWLLGAGWYTLLGNEWLAGVGKTREELQAAVGGSPMPYIRAFLASVVIAYTLAWLLPRLSAQSAAGGAKIGGLLGLTLIGGTLIQDYGFEARPFSFWLINAGYMIVGMALMGAVVGGWRKKA